MVAVMSLAAAISLTPASAQVASNGTVLVTGSNSSGQLCNGTTTDSSVPVTATVPAGVTVTGAAGGNTHTLLLADTGSVLARRLFDLQPTSAEAAVDLAMSLAETAPLEDDPASFLTEATSILQRLEAEGTLPPM